MVGRIGLKGVLTAVRVEGNVESELVHGNHRNATKNEGEGLRNAATGVALVRTIEGG